METLRDLQHGVSETQERSLSDFEYDSMSGIERTPRGTVIVVTTREVSALAEGPPNELDPMCCSRVISIRLVPTGTTSEILDCQRIVRKRLFLPFCSTLKTRADSENYVAHHEHRRQYRFRESGQFSLIEEAYPVM